MSFAKEEDFISHLKTGVVTSYCGWQLSLLIEYSARKAFRASSKMPMLKLLRRTGALLKKRRRLLGQLSSTATNPPLWGAGDAVFMPSIENHLKHMCPLSVAVEENKVNVAWLLREEGTTFDALQGLSLYYLYPGRVAWTQAEQLVFVDFLKLIRGLVFSLDLTLLAKFYLYLILQREVFETIAVMKATLNEIMLRRPRLFIAGRPKNVHPLAVVAVAKSLGVPTFFLSHTSWFEYARDKPQLYDLSCFDHALVFSSRCKFFINQKNNSISVKVCGLPSIGRLSCKRREGDLVVGFPAGKDYSNIREISAATDVEGIRLLIKGHPPTGDKLQLKAAVAGRATAVAVFEHSELPLPEFLAQVDLLICGKSNVAFEAAQMSVPVISYMCSHERGVSELRKRSIEPPDVAVFTCESESDVKALLEKLKYLSDDELDSLRQQQRCKFEALFQSVTVEEKARYILSRS